MKWGGSVGKTLSNASETHSANSFWSILSHTLKMNAPPGRRTRQASPFSIDPIYFFKLSPKISSGIKV